MEQQALHLACNSIYDEVYKVLYDAAKRQVEVNGASLVERLQLSVDIINRAAAVAAQGPANDADER